MNLKNKIIASINKYGTSCNINLSHETILSFKGIICFGSESPSASHDFINVDPSLPCASLIVADPLILNHLSQGTVVTTAQDKFQITKIKKYSFSDSLYYICASLIPAE